MTENDTDETLAELVELFGRKAEENEGEGYNVAASVYRDCKREVEERLDTDQ